MRKIVFAPVTALAVAVGAGDAAAQPGPKPPTPRYGDDALYITPGFGVNTVGTSRALSFGVGLPLYADVVGPWPYNRMANVAGGPTDVDPEKVGPRPRLFGRWRR